MLLNDLIQWVLNNPLVLGVFGFLGTVVYAAAKRLGVEYLVRIARQHLWFLPTATNGGSQDQDQEVDSTGDLDGTVEQDQDQGEQSQSQSVDIDGSNGDFSSSQKQSQGK